MERIEFNCATGERTVITLTPEEEAEAVAATAAVEEAANTPEALRLVADEDERSAAKVDNTILALINQTRDEWRAWAQTNFPSLTLGEQNRLGILFWVVSVAVRKMLR